MTHSVCPLITHACLIQHEKGRRQYTPLLNPARRRNDTHDIAIRSRHQTRWASTASQFPLPHVIRESQPSQTGLRRPLSSTESLSNAFAMSSRTALGSGAGCRLRSVSPMYRHRVTACRATANISARDGRLPSLTRLSDVSPMSHRCLTDVCGEAKPEAAARLSGVERLRCIDERRVEIPGTATCRLRAARIADKLLHSPGDGGSISQLT